MSNKKGDMVSAWTITIAILVLGLVIVLIFLFNSLNPTIVTDEVCHQSVIFRATLPAIGQNFMPLKCQTKKICITTGMFHSANCSDLKGETGITTMRINSNKAVGEEQIAKIYAEETFACWQMMGEGKVNLFTQFYADTFGVGGVYPSCVICSRIAFDEKALVDSGIDLNNIDIEGYMLTHKAPNREISFYQAIAGESGKFSIAQNLQKSSGDVFDELITNTSNLIGKEKILGDAQNQLYASIKAESVEPQPVTELLSPMNQTAILFMQITSPGQWESFKNLGTAALSLFAASATLSPGSFFTGGGFYKDIASTVSPRGVAWSEYAETKWKSVKATKATKIVLAIAVVTAISQQVNVVSQRAYTAGKCGDVSTGTDARNGCSVVRAISYNPEDISSYCSVIESIP